MAKEDVVVTDVPIYPDFTGIYRLLDQDPVETFRVWRCAVCGARVFYCRPVARPEYRCICGGEQWNPGRRY